MAYILHLIAYNFSEVCKGGKKYAQSGFLMLSAGAISVRGIDLPPPFEAEH